MIKAILAMDENQLIGRGDELPWYIPNDLKHFKELTDGLPIVMGRKTFESIGMVLPNRQNIVITTDKSFKHDGVTVFNSLDEFWSFAKNVESDIWIIGGANLIEQMFDEIEEFHITEIRNKYHHSPDAIYTKIDFTKLSIFDKVAQFDMGVQLSYSFCTYKHRG